MKREKIHFSFCSHESATREMMNLGLLFRLAFTNWVIHALIQVCAGLPVSSGLAWLVSL